MHRRHAHHDHHEKARGSQRSRERQQAAVAELGQRALAGIDLKMLMDEAVSLVVQALEVECSGILELLPEGDELVVRASSGWNIDPSLELRIPAGQASQSGYTLLSREAVVVEDV